MLTGRYRYRVEEIADGWFKNKNRRQLVVLEVEVSETYDDAEFDLGALPDFRTRTYWRDATPEDMMVNNFHEPQTLAGADSL